MSLFDAYGRPMKPSSTMEVKRSQVGHIVSEHVLGQPRWTDHEYEKLAREAYYLNSISYRCAKLIATCAAGIPWLLAGRDGALLEEHPLLDLIHRPNPVTGGFAFFEAAYTYHMLAGHNFIEGVGIGAQPYNELWNHRPDRIKVVPGPFGIPSEFKFDMGGKTKTWKVDPRTGKGDILQIKSFNPLDDWHGMSRVIPAAYGVDRHNASSKHNKALLDNGARPSGALVFEPVSLGNGAGVSSAPQEVIDKAEKELLKKHSGPSNAGKPMVLGGNVRWEQFGLSMADMDFDESKQDAARDICVAWGVPHILVVKGQATYNNMEEAKLQLYEETVLPLVGLFKGELNVWLTPSFADGLKLLPDLDAIPALETRREKKRESVTTLLKEGILDADEARAELEYGNRDPKSVQTFDPASLKALIESVEVVGIEPLFRYMKSVGLVERKTTVENLLSSALSLVEGDDEEDESGVEEEDEDEQDT